MSPVTPPVVALLGTGAMGAGMARNICKAGITLRVWNRTPERAAPLVDLGAQQCRTVAEAVDGASVVVTMLWDESTVEQALREGAGSFSAGAVLLQTTTVGAAGADRLAAVAAELGLVYLDSPVQGTKGPAEQGTLVVLASGPTEARAAVDPVLDAIGSRTVWVGNTGAGSRLKLATNAFVLSLTSAVAQSLALAEALGLQPHQVLDALAGGPLESGYLKNKGASMVEGRFEAAFGIEGGIKDADLIVAAGAEAGLDAELLRVVRDQLARAVAAGHGGEDISSVLHAYRPAAD